MTMNSTLPGSGDSVLPSVTMQYPTPPPSGTISMDLHPLSNYTFGTKEAMFDKDTSISDRFIRLKKEYSQTGTRRSVEVKNRHQKICTYFLNLGNTDCS